MLIAHVLLLFYFHFNKTILSTRACWVRDDYSQLISSMSRWPSTILYPMCSCGIVVNLPVIMKHQELETRFISLSVYKKIHPCTKWQSEKESMKVNWHFHWSVWRKGFATNQGLYSFKFSKFHDFP